MKNFKLFFLTAFILMVGFTSANAKTIDWVDWTKAGDGIAYGTLDNGTIDVTYRGSYAFFQDGVTGNLTNYWSQGNPAPYTNNSVVENAPTPSEGIALNIAGSKTILFSQEILNPVFAFNSWNGSNGQGIDFGTPVTILSTGRGYWGEGGIESAFGGNGWITTWGEPHGVVQLMGTFSSITFTDLSNEYWHGFTVGIEGVADNTVPEPATIILLGFGLVGLAGFQKKFRK
jgi:hypothetical protein